MTRSDLASAAQQGFDSVLLTLAPASHLADIQFDSVVRMLAEQCRANNLSLFVDLDPYILDLHHPLVEGHPECFANRRHSEGQIADPRHPAPGQGYALLRQQAPLEPIAAWWIEQATAYRQLGVTGLRARNPGKCGPVFWQHMIAELHSEVGISTIIADTPGGSREEIVALSNCGFDYTLSSLPWWDGRAPWFIEEHRFLTTVAPVIALVDTSETVTPVATQLRRTRLAVAALTGTGLAIPSDFERPGDDERRDTLAGCIRAANAAVSRNRGSDYVAQLTSPGASATILIRAEGPNLRRADCALAVVINPDPAVAVEVGTELYDHLGAFNALELVAEMSSTDAILRPGATHLYRAKRRPSIKMASATAAGIVNQAIAAPRITIANVTPASDEGVAAKRIVGESMAVEADIFTDGHPILASELLYRPADEVDWQRVPMNFTGNDRWAARFPLARIGRYHFAVEAWLDEYSTFVHGLIKKRDAHQVLTLDLSEGRALIAAAAEAANEKQSRCLHKTLSGFDGLEETDQVARLISPETIDAMRDAAQRPYAIRGTEFSVEAERREAGFASWYELFPRSQTNDPAKPGRLRDVIPELPRIRDMGFDVLYLTPIHPIGRTNRKGRNNAPKAAPGDPGSPYAIGAAEGGHDAIDPQLGAMDDFRALVQAAEDHGLEVALDFAIQCSPDHPWLKEHPGWFDWRTDGTIKYAENPPKTYEDIVNVDFYRPDALPGLWLALRDVVLHWVAEGVRTFRVDNPHTKPFSFWQWLINDIRQAHPDLIFLSEAFTRPKIMYRLAELGFSQSYTYFTWRNTKQELTDYLLELSTPPVCDQFRPHFFVNTPDINPYFLQTSGRPGFLIRGALAATLSGLWGIYSGFELCEAAALPGREEYLDSEKYEIRPRDFSMPGNIVAEITQLNRIRRSEPALQSHVGVTFYNAFDDNIIYYGKHAPGDLSRILVAVNLDPHRAHACDFEIPLWEWSLPDDGTLSVEDLVHGGEFIWHGKIQHMYLTPNIPYAIWRAKPARVN